MAEAAAAQAVIKSGGKQYLVKEGDVLTVERVGDKKSLTFEPLLITKDGKPAKAGKVQASVIGEEKGDKLVVFKMKAKKGYRRKAGHRQTLAKIKIDQIG